MHYEKFADGTVKCIEDEIPFEIPENWAWCRLKSITDTIQYGLSNSAEQEGSYRLLRITDIQDGRVNWDMVPFTNIEKPEKYLLQISDIVFARTGATVGKSFLITELPYPAVYASYLIRIRIIGSIFSRYIYHFFNSQCYWVQITRKALGIGQPNCNGTSLGELFIPLPPAKEQGRVVKSADIFLESAITLENEEYALKNLIAVAKSRILDLAIRGKLVPQDPNDEPVSVLLERIRAEKEELIKQGKIKRDKKESVIFKGDDNSYYLNIGQTSEDISNNLPFIIPKSWCWARLGDISIINPKNKLDDDLEVSFIPMPLIDDGYSGKHSAETRQWKEVKNGFTHFAEGDVGLAKITPCFENRKSTVFENLSNKFGAGTTELYIMRPYGHSILARYILAYVKSNYFIEIGKKNFTGAVGQQRISKEFVERAYFPIPPIEEQKRIVKRVNDILEYLDMISDALN